MRGVIGLSKSNRQIDHNFAQTITDDSQLFTTQHLNTKTQRKATRQSSRKIIPNHGANALLDIPPPPWLVVRRFVFIHFLVQPLDIPFANEATGDAHDTACNDQNATILIAGFLRAKLGWSARFWGTEGERPTKKYGVNQWETDAMQFVMATRAPRFVRGRATLVVSQGMCICSRQPT